MRQNVALFCFPPQWKLGEGWARSLGHLVKHYLLYIRPLLVTKVQQRWHVKTVHLSLFSVHHSVILTILKLVFSRNFSPWTAFTCSDSRAAIEIGIRESHFPVGIPLEWEWALHSSRMKDNGNWQFCRKIFTHLSSSLHSSYFTSLYTYN